MSGLTDILSPIQSDVQKLESILVELLDSQVPFVKSVAEYVIQNGGKRLRPLLTVLCGRLCGYTGLSAYRMGACIEFIHTASLLHDDVIDHATVRRGKASANHKWGNEVSVLVGDFFYCRASQILTEQRDWKILKAVTDAITILTEGEVLEITTNAEGQTTQDQYLKIIECKTAILFGVACQVGALLAQENSEKELALYNFGFNLGIAFQLADDILDYTASEDVFGKQSGIDLQEGKLTLPLIITLQKASNEESALIQSALKEKNIAPETIQNITNIIRKHQGFESAIEIAKSYIHRAQKNLVHFSDCQEKQILAKLADYILDRHF